MSEELTRHQIRERAFQTLFALNANKEGDKQAIYEQLLKPDEGEMAIVPDYLNTLVDGVQEHQADLDEEITQYLSEGWSLNRIAKTDLIILRIAFYEVKFEEEVPNTVAVNEALELTKRFSDDRSRRFVNGVLSHTIDSAK
ncbi:transcription antitermination factor NusB [Secundilactobacillus oryzae JCM 18671]|uniref:Transcription antitermination protein NusB n=1 Tax=Secundilactobacillus oryzae JCM 18671 TaxID=1291743 RepID=A0A081BFX2_9LACO|nr:transcription antitermination factor NusB [Secundilactobacillus oryzae]GAK46940.1 transcription antitermination factor NusB [Secundilactobacillus oryzae JCM 18671]